MDPPTYEATAATTIPRRSIQDLRAQIIAHGTVMRPYFDSNGSGYQDHIEVIVAKTPAVTASQKAYKTANFSEKQSMRADGTFDFQTAGSRRTQTTASSSSATPAVEGSKHYAVLIRRSSSNTKILIILKGEPKDSVEEALEWMLEKTEMMMHDMVVRKGRQTDEDECVVM